MQHHPASCSCLGGVRCRHRPDDPAGGARRGRAPRRAWLAGGLLALAASFKLWPIALLAAHFLRGSVRPAASGILALGVLSAASLVLVPIRELGKVLGAMLELADATRSLEYNLAPGSAPAQLGLATVIGLAVLGTLLDRRIPNDVAISGAWAGLSLALPLVWPHYLLVPIAVGLVHVGPRVARTAHGRAALWAIALIPAVSWGAGPAPGGRGLAYGLVLLTLLLVLAKAHRAEEPVPASGTGPPPSPPERLDGPEDRALAGGYSRVSGTDTR